MSWLPFASLMFDPNGSLEMASVPGFITQGSWLRLTNRDVHYKSSPDSRHFADHKSPSDPRRAMLLERPVALPRMIRVRAGSLSDNGPNASHKHAWHNHVSEFPKCCQQPHPTKKQSYVTKRVFYIDSATCNADVYCCQEPDDSDVWDLRQ